MKEAATRSPDNADRQERLRILRERHHAGCIVCGGGDPHGLRADFRVTEDGGVSAMVVCGADLEGYAGIVHGGIVSTLLDAALTNCLFSHGIVAVTGELMIRLHHPVRSAAPLEVRAWLERDLRPLYLVQAELHQDGRRAARARAKFMDVAFAGESGPMG